MSLDKAVLEIVEQIEADHANVPTGKGVSIDPINVRTMLVGYARQLRSSVKASEGSAPIASAPSRNCRRCSAAWTGEGPFCLACQGDAKDRVEKQKNAMKAEEQEGFRSPLILDGPAFGEGQSTMFPVPEGMPVGAYTRVAGERYRLTKEGLRHAPETVPAIVLGK